ncbi:MAG: hypothetical protein K2L28_06755 [Muribaculaceae bacterium]|nr:hypothetical protein [Muribaculaceae bacterium]
MDLSFDIKNTEGDHIMVALSYYDYETVKVFSSDPLTLTLVFYDVTLVRKAGEGYVGYNMLFAVSDALAKFMSENEDAVLCFYCDADTDVRRSHGNMLPQEYRSKLFSRMFEMYVKSHKTFGFINHRVEIEDSGNRQYAHFICCKEHEHAVAAIGQILMRK